jgi:probable F420-dependent oxidoreductase
MKLGILVPLQKSATPEFIRAVGETSEKVGFNSLFVGEHVVITDTYESEFPALEGEMHHKDSSDNVELDIFTSLAYLAAITKTIKLGTGVIVLPQRNPVYTAKEAATVDLLSNGRLILGSGIGWLKEEFEVVNAPFERRGARAESYLKDMKSLWCDDPSSYQDEFYTVPPCRFQPKPVQKPHPPIIYAGNSGPSFRRVAEMCQGWFGIGADPEKLAPQIKGLEKALEAAGRPRSEITVYASPFGYAYDEAMIREYRKVGVDELVLLHFYDTPEQATREITALGQRYLEFAASL